MPDSPTFRWSDVIFLILQSQLRDRLCSKVFEREKQDANHTTLQDISMLDNYCTYQNYRIYRIYRNLSQFN